MVVVTVTAILAGIILLYNSSSRAQIALFTEKVKVAQVMLRSKSLAISTYTSEDPPCGYGLYIEPSARSYSLIKYDPGNCGELTSVDTDPSSREAAPSEHFTLPPSLTFETEDENLRYVIFIPPDPRVLLADESGALLARPDGNIVLRSTNGAFRAVITVNTAGQVTF